METEIPQKPEPGPARRRRVGLFALLAALLPALAAIWVIPWFVTQDGSAHLYNAEIIAAAHDPNSPFRPYYTVNWSPLPNWGGHALTVAVVSALPVRWAGPAVTTITLVGFAAAIVWLRWRVAGTEGLALAAVLAVLLGLNIAWLLGFTGFLLGACLFPITLGVWWAGREHLGWGRVAALAALTVLGYFCHLVSLGLTAIGLLVLAMFTPGPHRFSRLVRTAIALSPMVPLGLLYRSLSRQGGPMHPVWEHVKNPFTPGDWGRQLVWVDPITLASKYAVPLTKVAAGWFGLFAPAGLLVLALTLMGLAAMLYRPAEAPRGLGDRGGWAWLAAFLLFAGVVGPDSLGPNHGEYLPQRVVLLGLVALVPVLNLAPRGSLGRLAAATLVVALTVQSLIVWDYALACQRKVSAIAEARAAVGRNQRVATLLISIRDRFRANPLLHADNLLGVGTGNIVWSNYETRYYYFPVQFRDGLDRPTSSALEMVAITDDPKDVNKRACLWECIVENHLSAIDKVVVWGSDPQLDAINARAFETVYDKDGVKVLRPRPSPREPGPAS